jgi:hypothetical protein
MIKHTVQFIRKLFDSRSPNAPPKDSSSSIDWREHPGCFERHLQRRYNNVLFPVPRRNVTLEELDTARHKDDEDYKVFQTQFIAIEIKLLSFKRMLTFKEASEFYREIISFIEFSYSIGGNISTEREKLLSYANCYRDEIVKVIPDLKNDLGDYESLSSIRRIPWFMQVSRSDSPIPKDEEIPSLLCEDFESITNVTTLFQIVEKNNPNPIVIIDRDIILRILERAYQEGFSRKKGRALLNAFDVGCQFESQTNVL